MESNRFANAEGVSMRVMTLFFLVDTSGSMDGKKIGQVNEAIRNVIPEIQKISDGNADAEIKISVLRFSTVAEWVSPPEPVANFHWRDLDADGTTALGDACEKLNEKLSKSGFMSAAAGSFAPAIFLMSDGDPTDEYASKLAKLKANPWFKAGVKAAIAIGNDANEDVLAEFTGSREAVVKVHTPEALGRLISFIAVTSSQVASQPMADKNGSSDDGQSAAQNALEAQMTEFTADGGWDTGDDEGW